MTDAKWFVIKSGEHEGRAHLRSWLLSAIKGEATGPRDDGWLAYAVCPICFAMVAAEDKAAVGDQTWAHEQWHARTDYPMPPEVAEAQQRWMTAHRLTRLDPP